MAEEVISIESMHPRRGVSFELYHLQQDKLSCKFWLEPIYLGKNGGFSPKELNVNYCISPVTRSKYFKRSSFRFFRKQFYEILREDDSPEGIAWIEAEFGYLWNAAMKFQPIIICKDRLTF